MTTVWEDADWYSNLNDIVVYYRSTSECTNDPAAYPLLSDESSERMVRPGKKPTSCIGQEMQHRTRVDFVLCRVHGGRSLEHPINSVSYWYLYTLTHYSQYTWTDIFLVKQIYILPQTIRPRLLRWCLLLRTPCATPYTLHIHHHYTASSPIK